MKFLTVKELYEFCKEQVENGKGDYDVWLSTGGYYDSNLGYVSVDDDKKEISLGTPD